jgi:hypothetical protein
VTEYSIVNVEAGTTLSSPWRSGRYNWVRRLWGPKIAAPCARHSAVSFLHPNKFVFKLSHLGLFELDLVVSANSTDDPQKIMPPSTSQVAFGLQYRPASVKLPTLGQGDFLQNSKYWQSDRGIRYIRFQWVDYTNATRYRIIPLTAFRDIISASRPGVGLTMAALGLVGASLAPGFSGTGEYLYTPDLSSLRYCGYAPGHASLLGWFEEKLPTRESAEREDALKVPLCPRGLVRDIVKYVYLTACHLMVVDDR